MGIYFAALSEPEQKAVSDHVRQLYVTLRVRQPETHVSLSEEEWCDQMCKLIASDPKRVRTLVEKEAREGEISRLLVGIQNSSV